MSLVFLVSFSLFSLAPRPVKAQALPPGWTAAPCDANGNTSGTTGFQGTQTGTLTRTGTYKDINDFITANPNYYDGAYQNAASFYVNPTYLNADAGATVKVGAIGVEPNSDYGSQDGMQARNFDYDNNDGFFTAPGYNNEALSGSLATDVSAGLTAYFKCTWQGSGPQPAYPASMSLKVTTTVTTTGRVSYGKADVTSGLMATANASDSLGDSASVLVTSPLDASPPPLVTSYIVHASIDSGTGIASTGFSGQAQMTVSNMVPFTDYPYGRGTYTDYAVANANAMITAQAIQDSREVEITSNLSTPDNPTYYTDPITFLQVANVRQPDGSMTDDIMTPPLTVPGLGASAGTPATYSAVISGTWGSNSTYKWDSTLIPPMAFSNQPISGTFNSSSTLGNNTQIIPNFAGTYYNPPASDGKFDVVTLTVTDGVDGAVAANTYTVRFHRPYPVNYRQDGPGVDIGGGVLKFSYKWDSSTGNLADLSNIVIGETITYNGNPGTYTAGYPGGYTPISPPYSGTHDNPTEVASSTVATRGSWQDQHRPLGFSATMPQTPGTYTYTGTQTYWYYDKSDSVKKTLAGPYAIVRSVFGVQNPDASGVQWYYNVTKAGSAASLDVNPN